jgi:hypothetical protein
VKAASWIPLGISSDKEIKPDRAPNRESAKNATHRILPKSPKPLVKRVLKRIRHLEIVLTDGHEVTWQEALEEFRINTSHGVTNPLYWKKYRQCRELTHAVQELATAFDELKHYSPSDHLTVGTLSVVGAFHKTGKVAPDSPTAEQELRKLGISGAPRGAATTLGSSAWIRKQVIKKTGLSKRTVDGIASMILKETKLQKGIAMK